MQTPNYSVRPSPSLLTLHCQVLGWYVRLKVIELAGVQLHASLIWSFIASKMGTVVGESAAAAGAVINGAGHGSSGKRRFRGLWDKHSTIFDAWLVAAAGQIGFVLVTMPYSLSQMGLAWGIAATFVYGLLGGWTVYLLVWLYLEYKSRLHLQGKPPHQPGYILQYYEVIGGLTGKFGRYFTFFSNTLTLVMVCIIQLVASASNLYYANSSLDKRHWQYVVGGVAFLAVIVPDFGHFRTGSFIGVATTMLTSTYLFIAALSYGQRDAVVYSGAKDKVEFFTGVANILSTYGGHGITIEILEFMKRPSAYKFVCIAVLAYAILVTLPTSVTVYWSAGDYLLTHSNAFAVLPKSGWQILAIASMVVHQGMAFVIFTHPLFLVCEKAVGVHTRNIFLRILVRIPVVGFMFFCALAVPFFGPINSVLGSLGVAIGMYIIPPAAFLVTYRTKSARESSPVQPPPFLPTWWLLMVVNSLIIIFTLIVGVGFGTWGAIRNIERQVHTFGFFDKCFQCPKPK